jgi:hypothetical protein
MSTVGNKDRVDSSHFSSLVEKEHVAHTRCTDRHHPAESEATERPGPKQRLEVGRSCGSNATQDRHDNCE